MDPQDTFEDDLSGFDEYNNLGEEDDDEEGNEEESTQDSSLFKASMSDWMTDTNKRRDSMEIGDSVTIDGSISKPELSETTTTLKQGGRGGYRGRGRGKKKQDKNLSLLLQAEAMGSLAVVGSRRAPNNTAPKRGRRTPLTRQQRVRSWIRILRAPKAGCGFEIPTWVSVQELTQEEKDQYKDQLLEMDKRRKIF